MKLPWKTRMQAPPSEQEINPDIQKPFSEVHRSPGLEAVLSELPRGEPVGVLDLGPAVPENIEFYSTFANRVQVVDALRGSNDATQAVSILQTLATRLRGRMHLVLLWDHLNYLTSVQATALIEAIGELCRPDARCLALIITSDTMPATPRKYRIVDNGHLTSECAMRDERGAPMLTPAAVERILRGFKIDHAFVLRHGVREFVATRDQASENKSPK